MVETKKKLDRLNAANKITLFRITMAPVLLFLILGATRYRVLPVLLPLMALTFLSDVADGSISRINHERTFIGQILDSSGDYLMVGLIAVFYWILELLPGWLFLLILLRLIFNSLCMLSLFLVHKKLKPATTIGGKITIASMMGLFILELLRLAFPGIPPLCFYIEIFAAVILCLSMVDKGVYFVKKLREAGNPPLRLAP
jgi:CDP-diacylglycerol--glycerol-3-phosphate 3-phosphatidyltransferase